MEGVDEATKAAHLPPLVGQDSFASPNLIDPRAVAARDAIARA
jgi:hypothetical protein